MANKSRVTQLEAGENPALNASELHFDGNKFDKVKVKINGKDSICTVEQANYFVKKGLNIEKA